MNKCTFNRSEAVIVLSRKLKQGKEIDKKTEVKEQYFG